MASQSLEEVFKRLRQRDVLFNGEAEQLIKECKEKGCTEDQLNNILKSGWVGFPSVINLASSSRQALAPSKTDWNFESTAFKNILLKRLNKTSDEIHFSDSNPPAFLKNALENSFFQKVFSELPQGPSLIQVMKYARKFCITNGNLKNGRRPQSKTSVEKLVPSLLEVATSNKEDIALKLGPFLETCSSNLVNYLMFQCIFNLEELSPYYMKFFSNELETLAYSDSKKLTALNDLNLTLHGIEDEQFNRRFNSALSRPSITSDIVIEVLWDACVNHPTSAVIYVTRNPALIDRIIDYVFLSHPPSSDGLNDMKRKAVDLMGCLQACERNGAHGDVDSIAEYTDALLKLYTTLCLPFKDMLTAIDPDTINGLCSCIFVKYISRYIKESDYYEGYMDPKITPTLHIILRKICERFYALRPLVMECFIKCFHAPSVAAQRLSTGKSMMHGIIDQVAYFVRLREEELVISTMKTHFTLADEYLEYAIKKLFCSVKPPFSHSLVYWLCDWFLYISGCNRHLVLQSGILKKFLSIVKLPGSMIATPRFPNLNSQLISMIERVDEITKNKIV